MTHALACREAFALYRERTEPGGLVAYHVSNRFLDLEPVLGAIAREARWVAIQRVAAKRPPNPAEGPPAESMTEVAMAADSTALKGLVATGYWMWIEKEVRPWTDDWTPLASALRLSRGSLLGS